jgi:hypothetical protein
MKDDDARSRVGHVAVRPLRSTYDAGGRVRRRSPLPLGLAAVLCIVVAPLAATAHGGGDGSPEPLGPQSGPTAPIATGSSLEAVLPPNRDEFIPVPDIGGNSDVGLEVGVAASYVRFRENMYPYLFRLDVVGATSFKSDFRGFRAVQQYHTVRLDSPQFLSPRLRFDVRVDFLRAVTATWFGVGNAIAAVPRPPPPDPDAASAYEYIAQHVRLSALFRIKTGTPFDLALLTHTRYEFPDPFPESKLSDDIAAGSVIGGKASLLETVGAGVMIDTRDSELLTTRGIFYAFGLAGTVGSAEAARFGEGSAVLTHFARIARPVIFANRVISSFKFGRLPFYELQQGDVFNPQYLIGGDGGVRGIRLGRYAGLIKVIQNTELRLLPLPRFRVFRWSMLPGATVFFDAGRVWSDYGFHPSVDGRNIGLKWGAGGGLFFQWDAANLFRIDAAYSPDDTARSVPVSFYFESGLHF